MVSGLKAPCGTTGYENFISINPCMLFILFLDSLSLFSEGFLSEPSGPAKNKKMFKKWTQYFLEGGFYIKKELAWQSRQSFYTKRGTYFNFQSDRTKQVTLDIMTVLLFAISWRPITIIGINTAFVANSYPISVVPKNEFHLFYHRFITWW